MFFFSFFIFNRVHLRTFIGSTVQMLHSCRGCRLRHPDNGGEESETTDKQRKRRSHIFQIQFIQCNLQCYYIVIRQIFDLNDLNVSVYLTQLSLLVTL